MDLAYEGLLLAARTKARLGQALSVAQHTEGHLQVVRVGDWKLTSTRPSWNAEPRLNEEDSWPSCTQIQRGTTFVLRQLHCRLLLGVCAPARVTAVTLAQCFALREFSILSSRK